MFRLSRVFGIRDIFGSPLTLEELVNHALRLLRRLTEEGHGDVEDVYGALPPMGFAGLEGDLWRYRGLTRGSGWETRGTGRDIPVGYPCVWVAQRPAVAAAWPPRKGNMGSTGQGLSNLDFLLFRLIIAIRVRFLFIGRNALLSIGQFNHDTGVGEQ